MKTYLKVLAATLTSIATGALAQGPEAGEMSAAPPPPQQLQSAPAEGDATFFYETLQPHGSWVEVSPFGPVWRPHVAVKDTSWRPYSNCGKWVWSRNAWCWESEYEWGWAPFHYGRWVMSKGLGWVWIPGREWSPAWVSWNQTSTHYGWAPLPPERSAYVSISSTTDGGVTWGFQFGLTREHYIYAPCNNFREVVYVRDYDHHGYRYYDYNCNDRSTRSQYGHRNYQPVVETKCQPVQTRTPEPSRRTTIMQQVVSRTTPSSSSSTRSMQQVVSQPRNATTQQAASQSRTATARVSSGNRSTTSSSTGSSADRRSSRVADIMARSRR